MLSRMTTYGDFRQGRYTRGILTGLQAAFLKKNHKQTNNNKKTKPTTKKNPKQTKPNQTAKPKSSYVINTSCL